MGFVIPIFKIVCHMANEGGFTCPGVNKFGACNVYLNEGVEAHKRIGACSYKEIRKPEAPKKKGILINPLKASKRAVAA
jgi:hypothetical protein